MSLSRIILVMALLVFFMGSNGGLRSLQAQDQSDQIIGNFSQYKLDPNLGTITIPPSLILVNCTLGKPLSDPVDMNTVIFKNIAKTIHVEKEVFTCKTKNGANVIALVSIYTELFENMTTLKSLNKALGVVTCVKGYNGTVSYCKSEPRPLPNQIVYSNCDPKILRVMPLSSPIEMETVVSPDGVVKTVEAEKEIFLCDIVHNVPTKLLDVNLFTDIFELYNGTVLKKSIESITCLKEISNASVLRCGYRNH